MVTYEEAKLILQNVLDIILSVQELKDALNVKKIHILITDIDEEYTLDMDYGYSMTVDKGDFIEYHILVNFCKIHDTISKQRGDLEFTEDEIDYAVKAQLVQTLFHEVTHDIIETNADLYKTDVEYNKFIETRVEQLSCELMQALLIPVSRKTGIPIEYLLVCAQAVQLQMVYPYLLKRGMQPDFRICDRVEIDK